MKNGRSKAPRMLIEGVDPDEVVRLQTEVGVLANTIFLIQVVLFYKFHLKLESTALFFDLCRYNPLKQFDTRSYYNLYSFYPDCSWSLDN